MQNIYRTSTEHAQDHTESYKSQNSFTKLPLLQYSTFIYIILNVCSFIIFDNIAQY